MYSIDWETSTLVKCLSRILDNTQRSSGLSASYTTFLRNRRYGILPLQKPFSNFTRLQGALQYVITQLPGFLRRSPLPLILWAVYLPSSSTPRLSYDKSILIRRVGSTNSGQQKRKPPNRDDEWVASIYNIIMRWVTVRVFGHRVGDGS